MNIMSFDGYIMSYINWPEGYIPWHSELFHCHVNGYITCYVTLKSSAIPPLLPQICLRADLQQIESKAYLFTPRQAGQEPQHPLRLLLVSASADCVTATRPFISIDQFKKNLIGKEINIRHSFSAANHRWMPCISLCACGFPVPSLHGVLRWNHR